MDKKAKKRIELLRKKIGELRVPEALIDAMWKSECVVLEAPIAARVTLLKEEYSHFFTDIETLNGKLQCLVPLHGHAVIDGWKSLALAGRWDKLTAELLAPAPNMEITWYWIRFLGIFDAVFLVLSLWIFESLVIE